MFFGDRVIDFVRKKGDIAGHFAVFTILVGASFNESSKVFADVGTHALGCR